MNHLKTATLEILAEIESIIAAKPKRIKRTAKSSKARSSNRDQANFSMPPAALKRDSHRFIETIAKFNHVKGHTTRCNNSINGRDLYARDFHLFTRHGLPIQHARPGVTLKSLIRERSRPAKEPQQHIRLGQALVAGCYYSDSSNYYHFLCDGIADILYFIANGGRVDQLDAIIMPYAGTPWQDEVLKLACVDKRIVMGLHCFESCIIDTAYISFRAKGGRSSSPQLHSSLQSLAPAWPGKSPTSFSRIYASRLGCKRRQLVNESELIQLLQDHGYAIVDCSKESVKAQISLFKNAQYVIAPHGAALTNIAWCQPGTKVLDIMPASHANPCFYDLAIQGNLKYTICPSYPVDDSPDPLDAPVSINLETLKTLLQQNKFL